MPAKNSVQEQYRPDFPLKQQEHEHLIIGEIREWTGKDEQVFSPVYLTENNVFDKFIGSYPLMDKDTALKALDAPVHVYDHGRGEWPLMSVEPRIGCLKEFVFLMK